MPDWRDGNGDPAGRTEQNNKAALGIADLVYAMRTDTCSRQGCAMPSPTM
jgi:hypothetical protein